MANNDYNSGKATAVKFFMALSCIASIVGGIASIARNNLTVGIILLVSLVWTVPMTISASGRLKAHEYIGTGFKICTLLFHNLIAGIILLCMNTEGEEKKEETPAPKDKADTSAPKRDSSKQVSQQPQAPRTEKSASVNTNTQATQPRAGQGEIQVIIFSRALYRRYLVDKGYSVVTPSGNPSTVDDYCRRIDFVCDVENLEWADIPTHINRLLREYDIGGNKQSLGAKSNNSVINALKRANECIQKQKRNS